MAHAGVVARGQIVLDDALDLPDGSRVTVDVAPTATSGGPSGRGSLQAILALDAKWESAYPGEFDDLIRKVQDVRDESTRLQQADATRGGSA